MEGVNGGVIKIKRDNDEFTSMSNEDAEGAESSVRRCACARAPCCECGAVGGAWRVGGQEKVHARVSRASERASATSSLQAMTAIEVAERSARRCVRAGQVACVLCGTGGSRPEGSKRLGRRVAAVGWRAAGVQRRCAACRVCVVLGSVGCGSWCSTGVVPTRRLNGTNHTGRGP